MNTQNENQAAPAPNAGQSKDEIAFANGGVWDLWMSFNGRSCSEAFDAGYDAGWKFAGRNASESHPALNAAWLSGYDEAVNENLDEAGY